jgi:hypothetical protein
MWHETKSDVPGPGQRVVLYSVEHGVSSGMVEELDGTASWRLDNGAVVPLTRYELWSKTP